MVSCLVHLAYAKQITSYRANRAISTLARCVTTPHSDIWWDAYIRKGLQSQNHFTPNTDLKWHLLIFPPKPRRPFPAVPRLSGFTPSTPKASLERCVCQCLTVALLLNGWKVKQGFWLGSHTRRWLHGCIRLSLLLFFSSLLWIY